MQQRRKRYYFSRTPQAIALFSGWYDRLRTAGERGAALLAGLMPVLFIAVNGERSNPSSSPIGFPEQEGEQFTALRSTRALTAMYPGAESSNALSDPPRPATARSLLQSSFNAIPLSAVDSPSAQLLTVSSAHDEFAGVDKRHHSSRRSTIAFKDTGYVYFAIRSCHGAGVPRFADNAKAAERSRRSFKTSLVCRRGD